MSPAVETKYLSAFPFRKSAKSFAMMKSTSDNGSEFLDGAGLKRATGCEEVYYAHPFSSWERGSNENGNRILRRFLPKGTDFSQLKAETLQRIEDWVNNYPRKIFGYKTANDMYAALVA